MNICLSTPLGAREKQQHDLADLCKVDPFPTLFVLLHLPARCAKLSILAIEYGISTSHEGRVSVWTCQ